MPWVTQLAPILKSHDMMGIVDGTDPCPPKTLPDDQGRDAPNPAYSVWVKKDQFLLSWINANLSESVLSTVYGLHSSRQVWTALSKRFASQSKARVSNLQRQLQTLHHGSQTCIEFLQRAKLLADQLAAIGKPIQDEELITFILNGLNPSFNAFVMSFTIATRDKTVSFADFQDELLNQEMVMKQQQPASENSNFALFVQRQGNSHGNKKFKNQYPPKFSPRSNTSKPTIRMNPATKQPSSQGQGNSGPSFNSSTRPPCQICGKTNHQALDCFHRMDYSYQGRHPPTQLAAMVAHTNTAIEKQEWFANSGANAHITNELENMTIQ